LPVLLRGLEERVGNLTAVVTVADDGGASGGIEAVYEGVVEGVACPFSLARPDERWRRRTHDRAGWGAAGSWPSCAYRELENSAPLG
jgi:hypothetical protein